ncbi:MAG TPA: ATP synthase F1 subunit gamma [Candidatus Paceibacterota bacterium]|nr:ATP synthase F1 subunit gamma [Candidatus Paceibacterota bacterium]
MASTKEIKRRIKSVKNTKKITKAMELVAASKMKRAISKTLASRLYSSYSWEILTSLSERMEELNHKFFTENKNNEKVLVVLITSNRGLCGGYNSQVTKKTVGMIKSQVNSENVDIITVGKKGDSAMRRIGQKVVATFTDITTTASLREIVPISDLILKEFKQDSYGRIYIAYTDFVSALTQKPMIRKVLPISKEVFRETIEQNLQEKLPDKKEIPYLFEGDTNTLLDTLSEKLIRMQIYQMILESSASEESSRMVAMKNANEAAGEMIDDLTLVFNKARQAGITREISEISAGMASVS